MAERVNISYSVKTETKTRIDRIAEATHRFPGQLLDLVIEKAWKEFEQSQENERVSVVDTMLES